MRTTSSIEAYNCVLNKSIVNKGNFFNFIHDLRSEEFLKREEMAALIFSGAATENKRRKQYMVFFYVHLLVCVAFLYQTHVAFLFDSQVFFSLFLSLFSFFFLPFRTEMTLSNN